ncbi:MAG: hypothetical protein HQ569_05935 [Actinobacteria bacterium]|nr:hypothetical protein [Actinomycetota bacterium]
MNKNIRLRKKNIETSPINWKERFIDIREDYKMLWEDYKRLVCKIGKLPYVNHIKEQLNKPGL